MKVLLILPNYNRLDIFKKSIHSFFNSDLPVITELILVDDASPVESKQFILSLSSTTVKIHKIFVEQRYGRPRRCIIRGLEYIDKEIQPPADDTWVGIIDNDAEYKPGWAQRCIWAWDEAKKAGLNPAVVSAFNAAEQFHETEKRYEGWVQKKTIGGLNLLLPYSMRSYFHNRTGPYADWDWDLVDRAKKAGQHFIALSPSYAQHIGHQSSIGHPGYAYAEDY